jgi:hypothetical protein
MGGRLEHEIRLLPQVLSCSFSKDDYVVVLIDASGDQRAIQQAVERILLAAGSEATVRVIGPAEPVEATTTRVVSPLVATATVATVAAIGVGALVGGLAAVDHSNAPPKRPAGSAAFTPSVSTIAPPIDSIDALRRVQVSAVSITRVAVPAEAPDHTQRVLPASRGSAAEAVSLTKAIPPLHPATERAASFQARRTEHKQIGRHNGKGPRPWSHSSRFSDHPGKGMDRG